MKYLFFILLLLVSICANAADVTLQWDPPTTNVDGTPLTDLSGYHVYQRAGAATYDYTTPAATSTTTTTTISGLTDGDYYWIVRAFNSAGTESADSNEVNLTILIRPGTPLNLRIVTQ